jgi:hypothetical protein
MNLGLVMATLGLVASAHAVEPTVERQPKSEIMGGSSSNGGGGVEKESPFIPLHGLGQLMAQAKGRKYNSLLRDFVESHPNVRIQTCSGIFAKIQYPEMPAQMAEKMSIELLASPSIWEKIGFTKTPDPEKFSEEKVCSDDDLTENYGKFVMLLYSILENEKEDVSQYLINKTYEKTNQKIGVVVTSRKKDFEAVGGTLTESTWFDHESGKVYWGPLDLCEGLACWTNRNEYSYFRHEFTHLVLYRALGTKYPKEKVWHDIRFESSDKIKHFGDVTYSKLSTSPAAAFIEGIANAMENGLAFHHPHVLGRGNFMQIMGDGCYYGVGAMTVDSIGQLGAPLSSETFVSSTVDALFRKWEPQDWVREGKIQSSDHYARYIQYTSHQERMKMMIDAIFEYAPVGVRSLAIAFDKKSGSDLGLRWLREYYFYDYISNKNITQLYPYEISKDRTEVCFAKENFDKFLEPALKKEEDDVEFEAKKMVAKNVSKDSLQKDFNENPLELEPKFFAEDFQRRSLTVSNQYKLCFLNGDSLGHEANRVAEEIQVTHLVRYSQAISMIHIAQFLEQGCTAKRKTMIEYEEAMKSRERLGQLIAETEESNLDQHAKNIDQWANLKNQQREIQRDASDEVIMLLILEKADPSVVLKRLEGGKKE